MGWAEDQRMEWLNHRLGPFNRLDLQEAFGISVPQASKDIKKFLSENPGTFEYNRHKKQYERADGMSKEYGVEEERYYVLAGADIYKALQGAFGDYYKSNKEHKVSIDLNGVRVSFERYRINDA